MQAEICLLFRTRADPLIPKSPSLEPSLRIERSSQRAVHRPNQITGRSAKAETPREPGGRVRTEAGCCCGRQSREDDGQPEGGFQPLQTPLPNKAKLAGSADLPAPAVSCFCF